MTQQANPAAFPQDFVWGVSTSSYQIEGAVQEDGRGETNWDRFAHTPGKIADGSTGDVACDHYHRYPEDIALMQTLGLDAYNFSIAWSRVQPEGTGRVNQAGLDFYSRLVDALLEAGITPFAKLFHWDLPQPLEERGGWANRATAEAFADYSEIVVRCLGDRVQFWATHNEPWCSTFLAYYLGVNAPGLRDFKLALQTTHNVLLSHGLAVPRIRAGARPGAQVGIMPNVAVAYPATDSPADEAAARGFDGFFNRWFFDPLAGRGYPQDMWDFYGANVPQVQPGDLDIIAAPLDYIGINYYNPSFVAHDPDLYAREVPNPTLERTADREVHAESLYVALTRFHRDYGFPAMYVTENGAAFHDTIAADGRVRDPQRTAFLDAHFAQAGRAIQAGVPLKGYFVWSLVDNFEWAMGYSLRYGITYVDYASQQRIIKDSGYWYRDFIAGCKEAR